MGVAWIQKQHRDFFLENYAFEGQSEWHVQLELLNFPTHFLWVWGSVPAAPRNWNTQCLTCRILLPEHLLMSGLLECPDITPPTLSLGPLSGKLPVMRGPEWFMAQTSLTSILPKKPKMCYLECSFGINRHTKKRVRYLFRWILLKDWETMHEQMARDLLCRVW